MCNHGCIAHFDNNKVSITNKTINWVIIQGGRDPQTGLYNLYMPTTSIQLKRMTEISFLECFYDNKSNECKSKQDLVIYYHYAFFCQT